MATPTDTSEDVEPGAPARRWDWIRALRESELDSTARLVAFTLSFHMDSDGTHAYPGPALLARESGLSLRSVKAKLRDLERAGWIECVKRGRSSANGRSANRYRATLPTRAGDAPVQDVHGAGDSTTRAPRSTTRAPRAPKTFSTPDDSTASATRRGSNGRRTLVAAANFGRTRAGLVLSDHETEAGFREELAREFPDHDDQRIAIKAFDDALGQSREQVVA